MRWRKGMGGSGLGNINLEQHACRDKICRVARATITGRRLCDTCNGERAGLGVRAYARNYFENGAYFGHFGRGLSEEEVGLMRGIILKMGLIWVISRKKKFGAYLGH